MTVDNEEKEDFIQKQIEIEERIIEVANKSVKKIKNILVKEMIDAIAIDSHKHKGMLKALLALVKLPTPLLEETVTEELKQNLEEHIRLEAEAIKTYKELLEKLENEKEKLIINAIYTDEIRHHHLLKKVHKIIVEKETLTEEEIWQYMWEDAFTHGSPGG